MTAQSCPDDRVLEDLLFGRLSDYASLEDHLLRCDECVRRAENLHGSDAMIDAIQAPSNIDTHFEGIDQLLLRGRQVFEKTRAQSSEETAELSGDASSSAEQTRSKPRISDFAFLAPGQEPEEFGRFGPYRILDVLGQGGMGIVFLAEEDRLRRRVALKIMSPNIAGNQDAKDRFLREARAMATVASDHVVSIHQVGEISGLPFLEMPLLAGQSLKDRLRESKRLSVFEVFRLGQEIATGLANAHEFGLVHRDIKPDNIWLEAPHGRVKILDFGLARTVDECELTQIGTILGTPKYMSPEQADGKQTDHRSDLFSLGSVLYRCAAGRAPFKGRSAQSIMLKVLQAKPTPLAELTPEIPGQLAAAIAGLMALDPSNRPQSAAEVAKAFADMRTQFTREIQTLPRNEDAGSSSPAFSLLHTGSSTKRFKELGIAVCSITLLGFVLVLANMFLKYETPDGTIYMEFDSANKPIAVSIQGENMLEIEDPNDGIMIRVSIDHKQKMLRLEKEGFVAITKEFNLKTRDGRRIAIHFEPRRLDAQDPNVPKNTAIALGGLPEKTNNERTVAEWVISKGGVVYVNTNAEWDDTRCVHVAELPNEALNIHRVDLLSHTHVNDDELDRLKDLNQVRSIYLEGLDITGACFRHFKSLPELAFLSAQYCANLNPTCLRELEDVPLLHFYATGSNLGDELVDLAIKNDSITNISFGSNLTANGIKRLGASENLSEVSLALIPSLRSEDLLPLANLPSLQHLTIDASKSKEFIAPIAKMQSLKQLTFANEGTLADLVAISGLSNLEALDISYFALKVSDLAPLANMHSLRRLGLRGTGLSLDDMREISKFLPNCEIWSDEGSVGPIE